MGYGEFRRCDSVGEGLRRSGIGSWNQCKRSLARIFFALEINLHFITSRPDLSFVSSV